MNTRKSAQAIDELQTLTASEVAAILRCSTKSLRRYCRKGEFPPPIDGPGRLLLWRKSVVAEYISRNQKFSAES